MATLVLRYVENPSKAQRLGLVEVEVADIVLARIVGATHVVRSKNIRCGALVGKLGATSHTQQTLAIVKSCTAGNGDVEVVVAGWQRCLRGLIDLVVDQSGFTAAPFLKTDGASSLITVKTTMRAIVLVDDVVGDNPRLGKKAETCVGRCGGIPAAEVSRFNKIFGGDVLHVGGGFDEAAFGLAVFLEIGVGSEELVVCRSDTYGEVICLFTDFDGSGECFYCFLAVVTGVLANSSTCTLEQLDGLILQSFQLICADGFFLHECDNGSTTRQTFYMETIGFGHVLRGETELAGLCTIGNKGGRVGGFTKEIQRNIKSHCF